MVDVYNMLIMNTVKNAFGNKEIFEMLEPFGNDYFNGIILFITFFQNKKFSIRIIRLTANYISYFEKNQPIFIR